MVPVSEMLSLCSHLGKGKLEPCGHWIAVKQKRRGDGLNLEYYFKEERLREAPRPISSASPVRLVWAAGSALSSAETLWVNSLLPGALGLKVFSTSPLRA